MKLNLIRRRFMCRLNAPQNPAPLAAGWSRSRRISLRLARWFMAAAGLFLLSWMGSANASAAVAKIVAGGDQTFFIKTNGTLWGLGRNDEGQLGDGTTINRSTPVQAIGGTNFAAVALKNVHTAFLKSDGTLWTAGWNVSGQLGDGTTTSRRTPVQVSGGTSVAAVAAGLNHTVFLKTDGTLWSMGFNLDGQLGDGTGTSRSTPVQVSGGTGVAAIAAGYSHTVFLKTDGTLWAVGDNSYGKLGVGSTTTDRYYIPVPVSGGTSVAAIVAGYNHTVFLKTDGTLWSMGDNRYGQLGDGTTNGCSTPVQVSGGTSVAAVAAGDNHIVFLKTDGTLWAAGDNSLGQLGDGTTIRRSTPVQVSGGTNVTALAAGGAHSVFLKADGSLWGTGVNTSGQLSNRNPPGFITSPALINQSILLTPIGTKSAVAQNLLSFTISAIDTDNGTLTYSASGLPSGATFTPATKTFSWTPALADVGNHNVTFSVTNGVAPVSETIVIAVTAADVTAPSVPTGLSGSAVSATAVLLTWSPSVDNIAVDHYNVYRDGTQIGTALSLSYSDTGLQSATSYTYTVAAVDASNNASAQSASVSVRTSVTGAQTRNVFNTSTLTAALAEAVANPAATFTINLAAGTYALGSTPLPNLSIPGTKIDGPHNDTYAFIDAAGLSGGVVFNVTASNVTISRLTFRNVATHAITIQPHADSGFILGCSFYGTGATAAILGRGCANWTVAVNDIHDIAGTTATAEPAIYFYEGSTNLGIANNQIQDCDRGIGFGTGAAESNGSVWIFNNMIADTRTVSHGGPGISVVSTTVGGASIENNTVYQVGGYPNSIEYNNNSAMITVRNNLTNRTITGTNSPSVVAATNYTSALASWFNNPNDCDLRLTSAVGSVVDRGTTISGLTIDIEGDARPTGTAFDIGADEYVQATAPGGGTTSPTSPSAPASGGGGGGAPGHWFFCALAMIAMVRKVRGRTFS